MELMIPVLDVKTVPIGGMMLFLDEHQAPFQALGAVPLEVAIQRPPSFGMRTEFLCLLGETERIGRRKGIEEEPKVRRGVLAGIRRCARRKIVGPVGEAKAAASRDLGRSIDGIQILRKEGSNLLFRLEVQLVRYGPIRTVQTERLALPNALQQFQCRSIVTTEVVHSVGHDGLEPCLLREPPNALVRQLIALEPDVLKL